MIDSKKGKRMLLGGALCLAALALLIINRFDEAENTEQQVQAGETIVDDSAAEPAYVKAYTEFLLNVDDSQQEGFPIRGYYLFDLNFDGIPELGIWRDSWGSMGGYFNYYYFDGEKIAAVVDEEGEPKRISSYTQLLADFEKKKVYLLKEMYLLIGNENGTYGYVREIRWDGENPYVYDILDLEVDCEWETVVSGSAQHECEDEFLADPNLEDCLVTRRYWGNEWVDISSAEYLKLKRELIPEENAFVELRREDLSFFGEPNRDEIGGPIDVRMTEEEIKQLFSKRKGF